MAKKKITEIVADMLQEFLQQEGYELYNIEFMKEGRDWFLRVYLDKVSGEGYIGTEDCEKVSRYLSEKLDEEDPIEQNYYLEVSSPGFNRELRRPDHFEVCIGDAVLVRTIRPRDGVRNFSGVLKSYDNGTFTVEKEEEVITFQTSECSFVKLDDDDLDF